MSFVRNIQEVRARARRNMEQGPVTQDYQLDRRESVNVLNEALATEIMCVLRYRFHYVTATGIHSAAVAEEFLENAQQEQEHASRIARRIKELGGKPEMNPAIVAKNQPYRIRRRRHIGRHDSRGFGGGTHRDRDVPPNDKLFRWQGP